MNTTKILDSESPKFKQITETATDLFMRFGVNRITIEEICQTAKVSKMTFYKYFGNKIDLAEFIIFSMLDTGQNEFSQIINQNLSFEKKMNQFINFKMYYAKQISKEFLSDFMNLSPIIRKNIMEYSARNQSTFLRLIEEAQISGEVQKNISIKFITYMFNHIIEMSEDERLLNLYDNVEDLTSDIMNFLFYGIMGKK